MKSSYRVKYSDGKEFTNEGEEIAYLTRKRNEAEADMERIAADRDKWLDLAASRARQNAELQRENAEVADLKALMLAFCVKMKERGLVKPYHDEALDIRDAVGFECSTQRVPR